MILSNRLDKLPSEITAELAHNPKLLYAYVGFKGGVQAGTMERQKVSKR